MSDVSLLVEMNLQLIKDEAYDAPSTAGKLAKRMQDFLSGNFRVILMELTGGNAVTTVVGYAVIDLSRQPTYIRHFFIHPDHRREGHGRVGFQLICEQLGVECLDVEVMAWNEMGLQFWQSLGFAHRYEGLRWTAG